MIPEDWTIEQWKADFDATRHKMHTLGLSHLRRSLPFLIWGPPIALGLIAGGYCVPPVLTGAFALLGAIFGYAVASRERIRSEENLEHISALERQCLLNMALEERAGRK